MKSHYRNEQEFLVDFNRSQDGREISETIVSEIIPARPTGGVEQKRLTRDQLRYTKPTRIRVKR